MAEHISNHISLFARTLLVSLVLLLSACQTTPTQRAPDLNAEANRAQALYDRGEFSAAATLWDTLSTSNSSLALGWQLLAADAWFRDDQPNIAANRLTKLTQGALSSQQLSHWQLLRVELALLQGDQEAASILFDRLVQQRDELPAWLYPRVARLDAQLGDPRLLSASATLAQLESQTSVSQSQLAFNELARLPGNLFNELKSGANSRQQTYLTAISLAREQVVSQQFTLITSDETTTNSNTPLSTELRQLIDQFSIESLGSISTVAILLPTSGPLKTAAQSIHEGIISSWLTLPVQQRPNLLFFDSGNSNREARGSYFSAADQGADWIIGPLRKESVAALIDLPNRSIPMLALNQPEATLNDLNNPSASDTQTAHFVFALPPEDGARTTAQLAFNQGHRNTIILRPESNAGQRIADAFESEFSRLGGRVLQTGIIPDDSIEYTNMLSAALRLDSSLRRHAQLQRQLGLDELGFRQQGRSDVDCLFIASSASQSRLILPQLKFLDLDYLPVYATQRVYAGTSDRRRDRDLNGLYFTQQGWLAGQAPEPSISQVQQWFPDKRNGLLAELFGLGRDSFLLLPYLNLLKGEQSFALQAASGQLKISKEGYITRALQAMQFRNGVPILLPNNGR